MPGINAVVLSWVLHGVLIPWIGGVAPPAAVFSNHAGTFSHEEFTTQSVADLVARGAAEKCPPGYVPTVVSPLGVVERRGKLRLIMDLQYVNGFIDMGGMSFRFESVAAAQEVLTPGDWLFTVDLEAAYHHVDMHESMWQYLGFEWQGEYYQFCVLPFGLSLACWVFTKLTRELVAYWRARGIRLMHYLDDFLFATEADERLFRLTQRKVLRDLADAGFSVAVEKLKLTASHTATFIGFVFDTALGRLFVSVVRVQELQESLRKARTGGAGVPVQVLRRLTGQLASMLPAVGQAVRIFTRGLYAAIPDRRRSGTVLRTPEMESDIEFWCSSWERVHGTPLWPDTKIESVVCFSDASDFGWGAHLGEFRYFGGGPSGEDLWEKVIAHGYFTPEEREQSSTWREGQGLLKAVQSLPGLDEKDVRCFVDNQALAWIWRHGSSKPHLNALMVELFRRCLARGIRLAVEWVPRGRNQLADYISKFRDLDDWMLNPVYRSQYCDSRWGVHTFDRFATDTNRQCERFNSMYWCPGSSGVDAFSFDWRGHNNFANPPFRLIGKVIRHLRRCSAVATVIVPLWPKQAWWGLVSGAPGLWRDYVSDAVELPLVSDLFLPGVQAGNAFGVGPPQWRVFALRVDFRGGAQVG